MNLSYGKTCLKRTCSETDTCLKRTKYFVPKYQFPGQSLINITCLKRTPVGQTYWSQRCPFRQVSLYMKSQSKLGSNNSTLIHIFKVYLFSSVYKHSLWGSQRLSQQLIIFLKFWLDVKIDMEAGNQKNIYINRF